MAAYRIDLIDEDDAGGLRLALLEEVPNSRSTHAYEHLDEIRTRHLEERSGRFSSDGPREQGLARPRRTHQEDALGQTTTEPRESLRVLEKLDDLLKFMFSFVSAGDVREGHLGRFGGDHLRLGSSELKRSIAPTLEGPQDPDPERDEQNPGQGLHEDRTPSPRIQITRNHDIVLHQIREKLLGDLTRKHRLEILELPALLDVGGPELTFDQLARDDGHLQDVVGVELRPELGICELDRGFLLPGRQLDQENHHQHEEQPKGRGPRDTSHLGAIVRRSERVLFSHIWITPQAIPEF